MLQRCPEDPARNFPDVMGASLHGSQKISYVSHCFGKPYDRSDLSGKGFLLAHDWKAESMVVEKMCQSLWWQECVAGTHHILMVQETETEQETGTLSLSGLKPKGSTVSPDSTM